jgi:hypothetical protein
LTSYEPIEQQEQSALISSTPFTVTASAPVKNAADTTTWKSYTDSYLKVSVNYPADWEMQKSSDLGPNYSFWFTKKVGSDSNLVKFAKIDGCAPNKEITVDGFKAYDSGWRSSTQPTRSICIVDKKYIFDFKAMDEQSRVIEDAMAASIKFTN